MDDYFGTEPESQCWQGFIEIIQNSGIPVEDSGVARTSGNTRVQSKKSISCTNHAFPSMLARPGHSFNKPDLLAQ